MTEKKGPAGLKSPKQCFRPFILHSRFCILVSQFFFRTSTLRHSNRYKLSMCGASWSRARVCLLYSACGVILIDAYTSLSLLGAAVNMDER